MRESEEEKGAWRRVVISKARKRRWGNNSNTHNSTLTQFNDDTHNSTTRTGAEEDPEEPGVATAHQEHILHLLQDAQALPPLRPRAGQGDHRRALVRALFVCLFFRVCVYGAAGKVELEKLEAGSFAGTAAHALHTTSSPT